MPSKFRDQVASLVRLLSHESVFRPLLFGLAVVLLVLAFASLASEVLEGDTRGLDMYVLSAARSLRARHPWIGEVMRDLSGLGSMVVLTLFVLLAVGYLVLITARGTAFLVGASAFTGSALVAVLKAGFGRLRPDSAFAELVVPGLSFPSGHATMSAAVFLTGGALIAATHRRWTERVYVLSVAALLTALVGMSRAMLGVHWATDVLGGWAFGSAWALLWLLLANRWNLLYRLS